jgi:sec-independent protein translocase protein TatA
MLGLDNPLHIAIVLVVVLLVFGAKRLPEMGRSLGSGLRGFKDSVTGEPEPAPSPAPLPSPSPGPLPSPGLAPARARAGAPSPGLAPASAPIPAPGSAAEPVGRSE